MNVLILNWRDIKNPASGGAEIILYELSRRLIRANNTVTWFAQSFKGASNEEVFKGIRIMRRGNKYSVFFHAFLYYKSLKKKPDLVLDCVNTICWQTPLYVERKKRILYANQSAREVFFYDYPFPLSVIAYIFEPIQYLTYKTTRAICYSESIKSDLVSSGIPKKKIDVFPLGIDHKRYKPGKKSDDPTFVFVSRFMKYKRADLCLQAMRYVIGKFPKARLYLIGYGKEESQLKMLIKKLHLDKNVFIVNKDNLFLEKSIKDAKVKLMQGAWGLVLPSVKEGWGMVITEAAACGTPSIVSNVSGLRDSVIKDKTGLLLTKNPKEKELVSAMLTLIEDEKLRKNFEKNCLEWSRKFSWERSFTKFYSLIRKREE